ncbi:MAG: glycogen/starch synthase [Nannocystaceae bacterium]
MVTTCACCCRRTAACSSASRSSAASSWAIRWVWAYRRGSPARRCPVRACESVAAAVRRAVRSRRRSLRRRARSRPRRQPPALRPARARGGRARTRLGADGLARRRGARPRLAVGAGRRLPRVVGPRPPSDGAHGAQPAVRRSRFAPQVLGAIAAPPWSFSPAGLEFYEISLLKAGLVWADRVTTTSPTYADEIRTPEGGIGFDGLLRHRGTAVVGILNGIDDRAWDPANDAALAQHYDASSLGDKQLCRRALQRELGLQEQPDAPVLGLVGRLTWQKGIDLLLGGIDVALAQGAQLAMLGSGEPELESALAQRVAAHRGAVALRRGYDEALSHRIFAGADRSWCRRASSPAA